MTAIISQDCENAEYPQGDRIPKNVVRGVRPQVLLVLREYIARPIPFKVQLWKTEYVWLKSEFGIMEFMWKGVSPFLLTEFLLA